MKFPWSRKPAERKPAVIQHDVLEALEGTFSWDGGRLKLWCRDRYSTRHREVFVVVQRNGVTVLEKPARHDLHEKPDHTIVLYTFDMDTPGLIDERELLSNSIAVYVVGDDNAQGQLRLDGVYEISLINKYLK